jgi:uncharacterized protein (DUF2141 family)
MANVAASLPSSLDLEITGLRSAKGNVLVCLTANPKAFPDCSRDPTARQLTVAAGKSGSIQFSGLEPGAYAVSLIHDENANGKLDTRLMIPREGFGFSRNPAIAFGPPKFGAAKFAIGDGEAAQTVRMKYML